MENVWCFGYGRDSRNIWLVSGRPEEGLKHFRAIATRYDKLA
jgi:hypothetical protein